MPTKKKPTDAEIAKLFELDKRTLGNYKRSKEKGGKQKYKALTFWYILNTASPAEKMEIFKKWFIENTSFNELEEEVKKDENNTIEKSK